jgi:hypothetical protein
MSYIKSFGECNAAQGPHRQTAEVRIRVTLLSRFNALAITEIGRVA